MNKQENMKTVPVSEEEVRAIFGDQRVDEYLRNQMLGVERPLIQYTEKGVRAKAKAYFKRHRIQANIVAYGFLLFWLWVWKVAIFKAWDLFIGLF